MSAVELWPPLMVHRQDGQPDVWHLLEEAMDPTELRPTLADHVELKEFHLRWGNDYAIVANRRDLLYYRLDPLEAQVVKQFDGTRSVGEILTEELPEVADLSFEGFADLTLQLQAGWFFTRGGGDVDAALEERLERGSRATKAIHRIIRSQPIEWRGVERPVAWLYRRFVRFAFEPIGVALMTIIAVGGFAAFLAISQRSDGSILGDTPALEGLVLLLMSYLLTICHELGHAIVLVHYGRRVKSAGFTIYFGSPAMFIDSTDGLMLDQRARILQSFGGPFAELVLAGAASIAALALPDSAAGETLLRFAILNYFVLFLNLVPLLELDGYWIFSDLIQVPDLRQRSLQFVRHELWARIRRRQLLTRQEVGLAVYGTLGVAFTILSLYGAVFFWRHILGSLVSNLWRGGLLTQAILVVLAIVVAGPVLRAAIDGARALVAAVREVIRRIVFRFETAWRVEAAQLLDGSGMFGDLPVEVLNELAGRVTRRSLSPGQAIVRQGDRATSLFIIRSGRVAVLEQDPTSGEERTLRLMGRGQVFGEVGLATGAARTATVRANEPSEIFELSKSTFDNLLAEGLLPPSFDISFQDLEELRAIGCFRQLASVDLTQLLEHGRWVQIAPGDVIVRQGDSPDAFYGVRSGQVEVLVDDVPVDLLGPGAWFGERGLLAGGVRRATVRARTPVQAFRLDREGFEQILRDAFRPDVHASGHQPEQRAWEH